MTGLAAICIMPGMRSSLSIGYLAPESPQRPDGLESTHLEKLLGILAPYWVVGLGYEDRAMPFQRCKAAWRLSSRMSFHSPIAWELKMS